ncbi:helix-turn-helix domain-containing protein [Halomarina litorea]|uniref:helix-turn-helix domain-containing protein n=1 Tax=Halomarina litorea TaxID=2961595 RepID=UPI0020C25290|nr:helix-turn-helix domain-containing protein [Halomarina sp. BCD28]
MRFVTYLLIPLDGELHPIEGAIADAPAIERRAIHHFRMLDDGTAVTLYELAGDRDRADAVVGGCPSVHAHDVSASGDRLYCHVRFDPNDLTGRVYGVAQTNDLVLDMPIRYTDRGALRMTAIGELATFREATRQIPDGVGLRLLQTGEYTPDGGELYAQLTERQQETLRAAVAAGYYEEPRRVTYRDIAEELGIAPGTVGEHLRKAESAVFTSITPSTG